jgi:hypothetical protein
MMSAHATLAIEASGPEVPWWRGMQEIGRMRPR